MMEAAMKGEIISREFQKIEFLQDHDGKEYACYSDDIKDGEHLTDEEKDKCLDLSSVLGDSW